MRARAHGRGRGRGNRGLADRSQQGQLELQAQAAGAGMGHVDRGQAPGGSREGARAGRCKPRRRSATQRREQRQAQPLDRLLREGAQVATPFLQPVEELDAGHGLAAHQRAQEGLDRFLLDQPEDLANVVRRQRAGIRAEQLVEHRLGVAHAPGGQAGDQVDRLGLGRSTVRRQDRPELAADLAHGQPPEVEALDARDDGRPDLGAVGRAEDEDDVVGRLLEGLEQDVPALA